MKYFKNIIFETIKFVAKTYCDIYISLQYVQRRLRRCPGRRPNIVSARSIDIVRGRRRLIRIGVLVLVISRRGVFAVVIVAGGRFDFLYHSFETVHVVGRILDHADRTVRLHQAVRPFDVAVSVALLVLALDVVRVRVFDAVLETIRGWRVGVLLVTATAVLVVIVTAVIARWIADDQVSRQQRRDQHDQLKTQCVHESNFDQSFWGFDGDYVFLSD